MAKIWVDGSTIHGELMKVFEGLRILWNSFTHGGLDVASSQWNVQSCMEYGAPWFSRANSERRS